MKVRSFFDTKLKILILSLILIVLAAGSFGIYRIVAVSNQNAGAVVATAKAEKGSIKVEISGSGAISPYQRYDIPALVTGKIISSPFSEGQAVKKGDILYKFDATSLEGNIQKTQNSIARIEINDATTRDNLAKTGVYAGGDGKLVNFAVKVDDTVGTVKVGEILDEGTKLAVVPFNKVQIETMTVGMEAVVTSGTYLASLSGKVSKISNIYSSIANGVLLYNVEITLHEAASLPKDTAVTARIGGMDSPVTGRIELMSSVSVIPAISGRVTNVYVANNEWVTRGQLLFEMDKEAYLTTLKRSAIDLGDAQISLASQKKQLEDYNITSPINGVVLSKKSKEGDTINAVSAASSLMVVADMAKVKFDMKIDELDIIKIKTGQTVRVTSDAIPDKVFQGRVTSIEGEGKSVNGVSTYTVQVTVDEPGEMKPGMSIDARIVIASKENALLVPAGAVQKKNGISYVTLPEDGKGKQNTVEVKVGLYNKDFVEILEGLAEGDRIVLPGTTSGGAGAGASTGGSGSGSGSGSGANGPPTGLSAIPK